MSDNTLPSSDPRSAAPSEVPPNTVDLPTPHRGHKEPEQIGPYRILETIGEGGMGLIYKAEQRHPVRRIVALKVIKLGMDTREVVARFEAERQALAMLSHPNVAKVLDAGMTDTGRPYFAMEFVAGVPLRDYCNQNKLTVPERLELFIPVCHAIQHAHQKGIIHRDLKPSNILVCMFDGKPVPKVIDFGIAKATNHQLAQHTLYTQTGAMIGTPEYMSPEQAMTSGLDVDTRTDIYSLGVILYELLTGTLPFDPELLRKAGLEGMARMIRETEPPKPSTRLTTLRGGNGPDPAILHRTDTRTLQRQIRGDLDWITLKAMEKDRTRRYETANGLAIDLQRYLNDEPVLARPPSTAYRTRKFIRKHKIGVIAAGAVVIALVLGIIGTTAGLLRARQARDDALKAGAEANRQRIAAEKARDDANAAASFLKDVFVATGSIGGDLASRMTPVVKRLDDGWLSDQPGAATGCRIALGFIMLGGNPNAAERQFQAAFDLARARGVQDVPELAANINQGFAYVAMTRRDYPAAEKHFRQCIAAFEQFKSPPAALGDVYGNLASVLEHQARPAEAKKARISALLAYARSRNAQIASDPTVADHYVDRAKFLMRAGRFKEALPDLSRAAVLDPGNHWIWYYLAPLQLELGDEPAYRASAAEMLRRFGNSTSPEERDRTAKVCGLSPNQVASIDQLSKMVDFAVASGPDTADWFQLSKGIVAFRAGRWDAAIESLKHERGLTPQAIATEKFILAMIYARQGDLAQARQSFDQAQQQAKNPASTPGDDDLGGMVENYLIMDAFRREAQKALGEK